MKKTVSIILAIAMCISVLCSCGSDKTEDVTINLGGLKGATTIGMVKLLDDFDNEKSENKYSYTLEGSADVLTPKLLNGELDIIGVPANLGAALYNKSNGSVKVLAVTTLGVLYIVEKGTPKINSIKDLKGSTIYATSKGATPEFALRYLLRQNGLDPDNDVSFEWKSEPAEVVSLMMNYEYAVAMLPQPYVTVAKNQIDDLKVSVDLTQAWKDLNNGSELITAILLARTEFVEKNSKLVDSFLKEYKASSKFAVENVNDTAVLTEKFGIVKAQIATKAIPDCNITYIDGTEMKTVLEGYYSALLSENPASVGGKLPDENYYYNS